MKRLTLHLDAALHAKLEERATAKGLSIEDLCLIALKQRFDSEGSLGWDPVLEELWDNEDDAVYDNL